MRRWFVLLMLAFALPGAAIAREHGRVQRLDRILPAIREAHPGRFYDAQGPFEGADGRMHYRIKWLTPEGRVVWFDTDAETGTVLGQESGPAGAREERRYAPRPDRRDERRDRRPDRAHDRDD